MTDSHRMVNPSDLAEPVGFSHAVVAGPGKLVFLAGQGGHRADGSIEADLVAQFEQACRNVVSALQGAGGRPQDVVNIAIYTTDLAGYQGALEEIGAKYRNSFGRHYPAMALLEVSSLFDSRALVELVATAVIV